jgi:hypothetical protein
MHRTSRHQFKFVIPRQAARDKAVKEAIAAGVIKDDDLEAIKELRASIEAVPLDELQPVDADEVEERSAFDKRRLITIEKARASRHTAAPTAESLISDDSCSD